MTTLFSATYPVYYEDTDAAGVVYYANYLKFAERARTDWLRSLGISQQKMLTQGLGGFVVHKVEATYHAPAKLDDVLRIECQTKEIRKVRMVMEQKIYCDAKLLVTLTVTIAMLGGNNRPCAIPETITQAIIET